MYMLLLVVSSMSLMFGPDIITLYITDPHTPSRSYSGIVHDKLIVVIPIPVTVIVGIGGTSEINKEILYDKHYAMNQSITERQSALHKLVVYIAIGCVCVCSGCV